MAVCPSCKRENPIPSTHCPACGAPMTAEGQQAAERERINRRNVGLMGMKWYKFLVYFNLPVSLLINGYGLYESIANWNSLDLSKYYENLQRSVYVETLASIVLGAVVLVLLAVALWGLIKRKWIGVRALLGSYLVNALFGLLMIVVVMQVQPEPGMETMLKTQFASQYATSMAGMAAMFVLNRVYFNKRKPLFQTENAEI